MKKKWTWEEKQKVKTMWEIGIPIWKIAEKVDRTVASLTSMMNRNREEFDLGKRKKFIYRKRMVKPPLELLIQEGKIEVEEMPLDVPVPENSPRTKWIDLPENTCQWALNGFWDGGSMDMPCCGLPVQDPKAKRGDIRRRFCEFHVKHGLKEK